MRPLFVGIAGGSGSGKSTVARKVADALPGVAVAVIDMDAYYRNLSHLPLEQRRLVNWDHPDALDLDLLLAHLHALAARRAIEKPIYDYVAHLRGPNTLHVDPADVVVMDGVLLLAEPHVREMMDVKVFVDTAPDLRLARRIRRDMRKRGRALDEILEQYIASVRPMHLEFVEPTKQYADVVVPHGGHDDGVIEPVVSLVRRRLAEQGR